MENITAVLQTAQQRAKEQNIPYKGLLTPQEAHAMLQARSQAKLVDVRSRAELDWVGRIPGAVEIEWATYPGMNPNPNFLAQLAQQIGKTTPVLFICRTGGRSNAAATLAAQSGYTDCYNIMEGFEGDKNADDHRSEVNGWRAAKLPWSQG
jgi:rhodanese-related sulfurtransferase